MLVDFYDDIYITGKSQQNPIINMDNIFLVRHDDDGDDKSIQFTKNIMSRLNLFFQKDIQFTKHTNCLQFVKYYQNMYRSIEYIEYLTSDCNEQSKSSDQIHTNITKMCAHAKEKLNNSWKDHSKQYLTVKKCATPSVFIPLFPNITYDIDLTNIDKAYGLLAHYDFSIYKKIIYNKLLLQTFEDCQYFEKIDNELFLLPSNIRKYYHRILVNSETSGLLTDASLHDKVKAGYTVEPGDYNIFVQYIGIMKDKTILKDFILSLELYRNILGRAKDVHQSINPIDFTYNEKLLEFGEMVREIIEKNNML